ncbi:NB-ARC domain-containing protein [Lentzea sp. NPDC054927]
MPADEIPVGTEAMLDSYRDVLSRRRVLVLLDNVRDLEQVRPLLPGGSQSLAVITSRNRLQGLVPQDRAFPLDVLDPSESMVLFGGRVGARRVAEEPEAAARLVELCAGLPLALAVVAARATLDQHPLGMLVEELEHAALDALDTDDPLTSVRAVFSWTFGCLSPTAARLFVVLGLHPGPDVTEPAATSLLAEPSAEALDELARYSLINGQHGRYRLHDLMRSYAAEEAAKRLSSAERTAAQQRFFDHLLHSALAATEKSDPLRQPISTPDPAPVRWSWRSRRAPTPIAGTPRNARCSARRWSRRARRASTVTCGARCGRSGTSWWPPADGVRASACNGWPSRPRNEPETSLVSAGPAAAWCRAWCRSRSSTRRHSSSARPWRSTNGWAT